MSRTEVLVVGAGPTGLLAALRLAERGVPVELIDEEWRPAGHSYALALHARSLELLRELGLAEELVAAGQRLDTLAIFEGEQRRAVLRLGPGIAHFPFVLALPQSTLEELLVRRLKERGVSVRWSHRLAGLERRADRVVASVQRLQKQSTGYAVAHTEWAVDKTFVIEASFVIGADGHRSLVRHGLGLPFAEVGSSEVFAVFECASDETAADELRLVLGDRTVSAFWPLPGKRARWSLSLEAPEVAAWDRFKSRLSTQLGERFFPHLDEAGLRQLLRERAPWFLPAEIGWSIEVRFERRLVGQFGRGRVWLAGDAAHLTGPAGMQSMNAGLHEAWELATRIAAIRRGDGGLEQLEDYGQQCLAAWRFLLGREGRLRSGPATPGFLAHDPARLLPCLPAVGPELAPLAAQVGLAVERS